MGDENKYDNPWPGLAQQARDGRLKLDKGAAEEAVKFAADCASSLDRTKNMSFLFQNHRGFSDNNHVQSALLLAGRFDKEGRRVEEILGKFIGLVNAIGDILLTAGKLYDAQKEDSKAAFDRLKKDAGTRDIKEGPKITPNGQVKIPQWGATDANGAFDKKHVGGLADYSGSKDKHYTDPIGAEDPGGRGGEWFDKAGEGMNPQVIADRSADWTWVADSIDQDFDNLVLRMERLEQDEKWTGTGAKSAIAAVNKFKVQSSDLTNDMRNMATWSSTITTWWPPAASRTPSPPWWSTSPRPETSASTSSSPAAWAASPEPSTTASWAP
ncbi:hypothetical protein [Nocardia crassostreae]|uniref:hypothetical protein n=1 Tax=Nocardia crassostreae TaxID=53428 RepID=UPI000835FF28|nr:hypothetical protein [Nocardia crassostreae]